MSTHGSWDVDGDGGGIGFENDGGGFGGGEGQGRKSFGLIRGGDGDGWELPLTMLTPEGNVLAA